MERSIACWAPDPAFRHEVAAASVADAVASPTTSSVQRPRRFGGATDVGLQQPHRQIRIASNTASRIALCSAAASRASAPSHHPEIHVPS